MIQDKVSLWYVNFFLGMSLSFNCEYENGLEHLMKSLDLGKLANNPIPISMAKCGLSGFNYIFQGKNDVAYQTSKEAMQIAQESGDIYIKGVSCSSHGMSCYCKGLLDEAKDTLLQALSFCEKAAQDGWWSWAAGFLGHVYFDLGEYKKAEEYYEKGISILEQTGIYPFWANMWKISLARSRALNSKDSIKLSELFQFVENINVKIVKGWAARHVGQILLYIDDQHLSEAEVWAKKAIEEDKSNCTMWSLGSDYAFYADLFKRRGDQSKAKENLGKAVEIFKACSADGWVEKYEKAIAEL
jgi:tetratricopeptide (TPR) repeat protein